MVTLNILSQLVMTILTRLCPLPARLFGLSVTRSVRLSVSKCFAEAKDEGDSL